MKNGTMYATRLTKAFAKHRKSVDEVAVPEPTDVLRQLGAGILGVGCKGDEEAQAALDRGLESMVDWNEIRVSSAAEVNRAMGNSIPQGVARCKCLLQALQSVFGRENALSLERLRSLGRRESRAYLESIEGADAYAVASVVLWSLGGHAIPVNDRLLKTLRDSDLVNPTASRAEVQAFLERHIAASDAKEFCIAMRTFQGKKPAAAKKNKKVAKTNKRTVSKTK